MAKVNEFEQVVHRTGKARFSDEANIQYIYSGDIENDTQALSRMVQHHTEHQIPRLWTLQQYYKGTNVNILMGKRRREEHLADNRATHNFARYVSQFIQGYLMGVPLKTSHPEETTDELLRDINRVNDADEHNSDLALDQSIYGRAYELLYRNEQHETRFINLSVLETFVIYDDTIEQRPIAAVRYFKRQFQDESVVFLYTKNKVYQYELDNAFKLHLEAESEHFFDGVPVVEYSNNKFRQGDFEDALSLIDLYDAAQSDTANYMQDLNDAMLVITGNLDIDVERAKRMKENNIIVLQTETDTEGRAVPASAGYIYKQYDVAGTEAYKDRLFNNILLFTSIPNLLDDKQGAQSAQSGEALKMKLFALTQKRATKERLFKKALRDRYRLISNVMNLASEASFDVSDITVTFTENLPSMVDKELQWFTQAGGTLSQETLLENLSFVENVKEEMERIEEENPLTNAGQYLFGGDVDAEE